jgi:hypothetical protein
MRTRNVARAARCVEQAHENHARGNILYSLARISQAEEDLLVELKEQRGPKLS